jgi:sugar (pentulose or hexulose) kinase
MSQKTILTIDAGTSRLKAALFTESGDALAFVSRDMQVLHPFDGASEMDMLSVWHALAEVSRELAAQWPQHWQALIGMAITGQGDGLWPLDAQGGPVGNAILWNDCRCKCMQYPNEAEITAFGISRATSPLFVGAPPAILSWLQVHQPERFKRIRHALHCKDWLNYRLTGRIITDRSDASTAMMNVLTGKYEFELLNLLGLPEGTDQLFPEITDAIKIIGTVTPAAEAITSIPAGLPLMTGALDVAASAYGAGARQPGDAVTILGTTFSNLVLMQAGKVSHLDVAGSSLCYLIPDLYMRLMATTNGASAFDWARQTLLPGRSIAEIEQGVDSMPEGAEGVFFQPYLHGERSPFRESRAAGAFFGISARHTAMHLMRAVFEGLVFSIRDCYDHLPKGETPVILAGGAANSKIICQVLADTLNRPTLHVPDQEFGLLGMASSLLETLGYPLPARPADDRGQLFTPRPQMTDLYQEGYQIFRQLREASLACWKARDSYMNHLPAAQDASRVAGEEN